MTKASPKLEWCVVRLGEDMNWWVDEISDPVRWDVDGLSIVDPRQISYILEQVDSLREYGLQDDIVNHAFYTFAIAEDLGKGKVRLARVYEVLTETDEPVFALPDVLDEETGPYADFVNHITRLRVKMLNDLIDFKSQLTIEELEEEIREQQNQDYMEGAAVHFFSEITNILEYVPEGFELDEEEDTSKPEADDLDDDIPDIDEDESDGEKIEEDETMRWDEDDEEEDDDAEENEDLDELGDDEEDK